MGAIKLLKIALGVEGVNPLPGGNAPIPLSSNYLCLPTHIVTNIVTKSREVRERGLGTGEQGRGSNIGDLELIPF
jgi:hypothetical protein